MRILDFLPSRPLFAEISQTSCQVLDGERDLELPLERTETGSLTEPCRERLKSELQTFLRIKNWQPPRRVFCAVGARGVSLRHLTVPAASKEEWPRLVALQIEREFPVAPDELSWGCSPLDSTHSFPSTSTSTRHLLIAAVKRAVIDEYTEILSGAGLIPIFTVGALARTALLPEPPDHCALLEIDRHHSELICFEHGIPSTMRLLPWGSGNGQLLREAQRDTGPSAAGQPPAGLPPEPAGDLALKQSPGFSGDVEVLAGLIQQSWTGQKLYLISKNSQSQKLTEDLSRALGGAECQPIDLSPAQVNSAAILGLQQWVHSNGARPLLVLQTASPKRQHSVLGGNGWPWAILACWLLSVSLSLRYAEAFLGKTRLSQQVTKLKTHQAGLPDINPELSLLQHLHTNQPPFLEALFIMANAALPGTRIESLSLNRRGDLSLRAVLQQPQPPTDFRSKLIASGFFSSVVLEEQTPTPDRQKLIIRIHAQWKPAGSRPSPSLASASAANAKPAAPAAQPGLPASNRALPAPPDRPDRK